MADKLELDQTEIKPLIPESSTSESTTVEVVLNDLEDRSLVIPDYQRDSDQWDNVTKSLFIESVINNLSVPAFFFEVTLDGGVEKNDVIDGQQRITTLSEFRKNKFRMVDSDNASYLSPQSVHYANKTFDELPEAYQKAFKKYRLAVIKLRSLDDQTRLEVFRRINRGGTPLSGQDIRLAYYGSKSPSLALIRLAGVYDPDRPAAKRFLSRARDLGIKYPWKDEAARKMWESWWSEKEIARGQKASEAFLWAITSSQVEKLDAILQNNSALQALNCRFNGLISIDAALDASCAQFSYQDQNMEKPPALMPYPEMRDRFFPAFESWIGEFLGMRGPSLPVSKHRILSSVIGAAYSLSVNPSDLTKQQWTDLVEFVRRPQEISKNLKIDYPQSKGRWGGTKGYKEQFIAAKRIVGRIVT